jgi:hypothetical protein
VLAVAQISSGPLINGQLDVLTQAELQCLQIPAKVVSPEVNPQKA